MSEPWNKNIERLLDLEPSGADSTQLRSALNAFLTAWNADPQVPADLDAAVVAIANVLTWDVDDARDAFNRFSDAATEESNNPFKESFSGSKEQLLFGEVVGEVLGIPAVFAALLSPTGGMVGPGGASIHVRGGVLGYHGVAHDAGGYLCRRHKIDPGYEYILEHGGPPCEDSPLAGQISGIAFWFKKLKLGWANLLASADPTAAVDLGAATADGVLLNRDEISFLQTIITRESIPTDSENIAAGLESLQERGFVHGDAETGYTVNDQLVLAAAVSLQPELMIETSTPALAGLGDAGQTLRYYKWGDFVVEQTSPTADQVRLAGLRDTAQAVDRLQQVMPLAPTELDALSLTLSEQEFEAAQDAALSGAIDPHIPFGLDTAEARAVDPAAAADLNEAVSSGEKIGAIRVQRFDGREVASTRDVELYQGSSATWFVSRDSRRADQVAVGLASPKNLDQELGLASSGS